MKIENEGLNNNIKHNNLDTKFLCCKCGFEGTEKDLVHFETMINDDDGWLECPECRVFVKWGYCIKESEMRYDNYFKD